MALSVRDGTASHTSGQATQEADHISEFDDFSDEEAYDKLFLDAFSQEHSDQALHNKTEDFKDGAMDMSSG